MERRSFLLALAAFGLVAKAADARPVPKDFRSAALTGGSFAMMTSQLALTKTGNRDVIDFAKAEIAEQVQVAEALSASPGTAPLRRDHATGLARLRGIAAGSGFDRAYVQGQIVGHRELLALNQSYLQTGRDPQVQGVAQMSLPIIQRHLAILNNLREIG